MDVSAAHQVALAVLVMSTGTATYVDCVRRRIPNALSLVTALVGVGLATAGITGISVWSSLAGCALGLALMLPGHVIGGTGAGDVKLFAAAGTVLGAGQVFEAFLCVLIAGGVLALAVALSRGRLALTVTQATLLCSRPAVAKTMIESPAENNRFPFAPAIAAGCVLAVLR